jgi:hypothetical protein
MCADVSGYQMVAIRSLSVCLSVSLSVSLPLSLTLSLSPPYPLLVSRDALLALGV